MPNATDYVAQYGTVPFSQMPFNDADNVSLCGVLYMPVENVVSDSFGETVTMKEACDRLYAYNGYRHVSNGLLINKAVSRCFTDLAEHSRYSDLKLTGCVGVYDADTVTQFGASTVILPDGTLVIVFRGTDDTLVGWIEDVDIIMKGKIRSYELALDYLEKAAAAYDGNIIICGHSKGGHLALYCALNCQQPIRDRIIKIYNNEGPGFYNYEPFKTPEYREILGRYKHFVPQSSFVGMLLAHDRDYTVIKSRFHLGLLQHNPNNWQIVNGELVTLPELSLSGKITELSLIKLFSDFTAEQCESFYNLVVSSLEATKQTTLLGVAKHIPSAATGIIKNWIALDRRTKKVFIDALNNYIRLIAQSYDEIKNRVVNLTESLTV